MLAHRATADVALMKLKVPHAGYIAPLMPPRARVAVGERFVVRGYGATIQGNGNSAGRLREADARRHRPARQSSASPGRSRERRRQAAGPRRLHRRFRRAGLSEDDSGYLGLYGVVSWSTAPNFEDGCGGVTGVTPIELYRGWIEEQAKRDGERGWAVSTTARSNVSRLKRTRSSSPDRHSQLRRESGSRSGRFDFFEFLTRGLRGYSQSCRRRQVVHRMFEWSYKANKAIAVDRRVSNFKLP